MEVINSDKLKVIVFHAWLRVCGQLHMLCVRVAQHVLVSGWGYVGRYITYLCAWLNVQVYVCMCVHVSHASNAHTGTL